MISVVGFYLCRMIFMHSKIIMAEFFFKCGVDS